MIVALNAGLSFSTRVWMVQQDGADTVKQQSQKTKQMQFDVLAFFLAETGFANLRKDPQTAEFEGFHIDYQPNACWV